LVANENNDYEGKEQPPKDIIKGSEDDDEEEEKRLTESLMDDRKYREQ